MRKWDCADVQAIMESVVRSHHAVTGIPVRAIGVEIFHGIEGIEQQGEGGNGCADWVGFAFQRLPVWFFGQVEMGVKGGVWREPAQRLRVILKLDGGRKKMEVNFAGAFAGAAFVGVLFVMAVLHAAAGTSLAFNSYLDRTMGRCSCFGFAQDGDLLEEVNIVPKVYGVGEVGSPDVGVERGQSTQDWGRGLHHRSLLKNLSIMGSAAFHSLKRM